jgi:uncharacterized repeat protein (TIGR03803 family)
MRMTLRPQPSFVACLTLFCVAMAISSPAQTLTTLANFDNSNGASPVASLIQAADGNLYGTTLYGGSSNGMCGSGCGTVFKIAPSGVLTTLYNFCSQPNCTDGYQPVAALVQGNDGNLYGTTLLGGATDRGTIFRVTPGGTLTTIHSFCSAAGCEDGYESGNPLVLASDGNFYGTAGGGTAFVGVVFKITPGGTLTTLYNFCSLPNCADGKYPNALVEGTDGNYYGTTLKGGSTLDGGTFFKITPGGALTTLYNFCSLPNCTDGSLPMVGLVQGTDGSFYGTTFYGGSFGEGTIFRITPSGTLTTLRSLDLSTDGSPSTGSLIQATDGNFYGTTFTGGPDHTGAAFRITPAGSFAILYNFCSQQGCLDGSGPEGGLVQATNGLLYGTTEEGGSSDNCPGMSTCGTVFSLTGPTPTAAQFVPVTPCRLVDTRQTKTPIQGGTFQFFNVPQLGDCKIPATASAYSLNVTVAPHQPLNYLTIWPAGRPQPTVSTMNSTDGRIKANAAIVPAGANTAVSIYATDTTDVILDIDGYFAPASSETYEFYPLTPCRVVDTRSGSGFPPALGPPSLVAKQQRDLPILSSSCLQGITNPLAYSLNVTVVPSPAGQPLGYLTVWPSNQTQPVVSTLNNPTATVVANAAIVPAAPNGDIDVYAYNSTDLILDINGYFAAPGTGGLSLYPVAPCRVLDTRNGNGQPFMGEKAVNVVGSPCAPPSNAQAYVFNATVVPPGSMPYLTLWADGQQQPVVSTLNAYDGFITSNMAIVPTTNGSIDAYAAGLTQLILDISGYFAP